MQIRGAGSDKLNALMPRSASIAVLLCSGAFAACTFGGGVGGSGVVSLGESMSDGMPGTEEAGPGDVDTDGPNGAEGSSTESSGASFSDDGTNSDSDSDSDSGGPMATAMLTIGDGSEYRFAPVALPNSADALIVVHNVGDGPALNLTPVGFDDASFAFVGGFPGQGGTCGEALDAGAECLVGVTFQPLTWGDKETALELAYDNGDGSAASLSIFGRGHGLGPNRLSNAGFGANLDGWDESPSSWTTQFLFGGWAAFAGENSGVSMFVLTQVVSVQDRAEMIDAGQLRGVFAGESRAATGDERRFELEFLGDNGSLGLVETPGFSSSALWMDLNVDVLVPSGTRQIRYAAVCRKPSGNQCDAWFDKTSVQLKFPEAP